MAQAISTYSGIELDTLYEKGLRISENDNGWIKLTSSAEAPINLDNVQSPALYAAEYWYNGPEEFNAVALTGRGPIMIYTSKKDEVITQNVWYLGFTYDSYHRTNDGTGWGNWILSAKNDYVTQESTAPANPVNGQIWIDTSGSFPTLKRYNATTGTWDALLPGDAGLASVYDTNGRAEDFFQYANAAMEAVTDSDGTDYTSHMEDATIHVSDTDVANWDQKATTSSFGTAIDNAKLDLRDAVTTETSDFSSDTSDLAQAISDFENDLNTHLTDMTIHFSNGYTTQKAILDAKADDNHTHFSDGRVEIDASMVIGVLDPARIPDEAKDITVYVETDAEKAALTGSDVQAGDWVYVETTKLLWHVTGVVSDVPQYQKFSTGGAAYSWSNISGKPTTMAGLGITDLNTKTEITNLIAAIVSNNTAALSNLNAIEAKTDLLTRANLIKSQKLQSSLLEAIEKLQFILAYTIS